jgi:hypothetical protein
MTVKFTWVFPHLQVVPSADNLGNIIDVVHWRLIATEDGYSADVYGSVSLTAPDPDSFTEFSKITKETVQIWVENILNQQNPEAEERYVDNLKRQLVGQIQQMKSPPVVTMAPPWE